MIRISFLLVLVSGYACTAPDCVRCVDVEGYPQGVICQETFEAIPEDPKFSWAEFAEEALDKGCMESQGD